MPESTTRDRTPIIVAIIGLIGVVLASTIPLLKDKLSEIMSPKKVVSSHIDRITPIKIGNQIWMQNNLNVDHFSSGESIPEAKSLEEWQGFAKNKMACWSYREYSSNYAKYGKFYNFYAVSDILLKLAPLGWHIPSKSEWQQLITYLNDNQNGHNGAGKRMKSSAGWKDGNGGNNDSGFTAVATGFCGNGGGFIEAGIKADWWSSTDCGDFCAFACELLYNSDDASINEAGMASGFNVRCVKD